MSPAIVRFLVPLCWTLWGVLLCAAVFAMTRMLAETDSSPEVSAGLGVYDPRATRMATGSDVLNYMVLGSSPGVYETVRLLLDNGADPNAVDSLTGETPIGAMDGEPEMLRLLVEHGADFDRVQPDGVPVIVDLIGQHKWESALYLIEKGARLDVGNGDGLSVDYYLKEWKESVYGAHPEGWDKVREAIAARRRSLAAGH